MKKSILVIAVILLSVAFQQPKTYTLRLTDTQLGQLYDALNRSESPHIIVAELQAEIMRQYNAQLPVDSTKKK